jgi:AcrR family transcriptional regulator
MADATDPTTAREAAILDAATGVFRRYGFKKTSMDDLARAAGLSRQGLYLHFSTKEALFKATALRVFAAGRAAGRAALAREDADVEERIVQAFVAMRGKAVGADGADTFAELVQTATQLFGAEVGQIEEAFVGDIARGLRAAGVMARWKELGFSAKELAQHLMIASAGAKQQCRDDGGYRDAMRTAVRLVCRGGR